MGVVLARVDERLIHGQVALAWLREIDVDMVVVVDDESARDPLKTTLLEMAVSGRMKCLVKTKKDAIDYLKKYQNKKVFMCVKSSLVLEELMNAGVTIPRINIGGIYARKDRRQYFKTIYLTEEEKVDLLRLEGYSTDVFYQVVPRDEKINILSELKNK